MPYDRLLARFTWASCSAAVCCLAVLDVLGWGHVTAMFAGALMLSGDR
jgi:hypothetical protein